MEGSSMVDGFARLHPCFPTNTRIAIVGGGPSGLSAAYALCRLGYSHVTVLEKNQNPGGMCESVEIEGLVYDLGGQVLAANSAPSIFHLAKEIGAEMEEMDTHKFALIDSSTGALSEMKLAEDYVSMISLTLKLQDKAKESGRIGVHAVSELAPDLAPDFLKSRGFASVPKSVMYGYTASGYGYLQDMAYAYVHEFTRTSMAGKIRRFKGGYMSLWKRLSERLPAQVCCNTEVLSVVRDSSAVKVKIRCEDGVVKEREFDKIVVSGAFPFNSGKTYRSPNSLHKTDTVNYPMDMDEMEKMLFSKVRTIDYYTTVLKIKRLDHIPKGFYYFDEFIDDPSAIGNPVAMQRFYQDTDVFLFWSYGNSADIQGTKVAELAIAAAERMGGEIERVILQRRFNYFPHVSSKDMKDGFYNKLEILLQGHHNTYFVGGLMAFELTERNSSYAFELVQKHFSNDNPKPNYPYVKRLLTLRPSHGRAAPRQLDESPGVEFPELSSLDAYLRHWGTHSATQFKTLYTWINEKGHVISQRTYKELHSNASIISEKLRACKNPSIKIGDRVLLVYVPGLDFIDAFFGCLRAGIIPVPAIPPDPSQKSGQALLHVSNIAKACDAVAILSTTGYHITVKAASVRNMFSLKASSHWPVLPWLHTDSWVKKSKISSPRDHAEEEYEPATHDVCFLQFTSGSTGEPKGVMITCGGLIHNVKMMRQRYRSTSNTVLVSWLPQYHDMGLIGGLFTSMVSGGSAILFSPVTFIRDPLLWLQTIATYRATHSAGPNFAFELLNRRLEANKALHYDLSSMVFFMVAAEPIRAATMRKFLELTQPFGLSEEVMAPGYGLAENCVYVCSAYGESKDILVDWQDRVCCGYISRDDDDDDDADVRVKIVDPDTYKEHEETEKEGEIWISSRSAGVGYWNKEELSQTTFGNELNDEPGRKYTRTGDLGRIVDGKLFVTGRIKDLIIVAGRNVYSSDVEKTAENSCDFIRPGCCAAIGVPNETLLSKGIPVSETSDQVGLVIIAEVREVMSIPNEAVAQIQTSVAEEHGVMVASVLLIKPKTISKTTSGKIKRYECLKRFVDGTLDVVHQEKLLIQSNERVSQSEAMKTRSSGNSRISKSDIISFLIELLSEMTGVSTAKISTTESLVSYGVDSIGVVRAAQKLSDFLGVPVGAMDIFTATCVEDLASFADNLLKKHRPRTVNGLPNSTEKRSKAAAAAVTFEASSFHKLGIWFMQLIALAYVCFLLMLPAYFSISTFAYWFHAMERATFFGYLASFVCAPLCWMLCIFSTCICISLFGTPFLQPNYALNSEISIWSLDFVKWWALYKAQEASSKVLAVHLRGTVFMNYWFRMLGAKVASSALIDTIDITDPYLVSIGEEAVLAEGALLQSHQVKNGILSLSPIKIGSRSSVGPYAFLQRGTVLEDGDQVLALVSSEGNTEATAFHEDTLQKGKTDNLMISKNCESHAPITHLLGIYAVGCVGSLSAATSYLIYLSILREPPTIQNFGLICVCGAFHWFPYTIVAYAVMANAAPPHPLVFAFHIALGYTTYGLILSCLTFLLKSYIGRDVTSSTSFLKTWFLHRTVTACHIRFAKFLSGTEAFCTYLRCMGAKVGRHCSIRAINPVSDPELVSLGDGVHLGDFSRIVAGYYSSRGYISRGIEIQDNSVVGSQGLVLPGSVLERDVILGALSVAPPNRVLQAGGVFVGSPSPVMVKNTLQSFDDRIEEMDIKYKKVLGNLAANLAASTLKLSSRYFHRIGAAGRGTLRIYDHLSTFHDHQIFSPGKKYPVILRHSNCLSSDDDARLDPRGAALRIISSNGDEESSSPLLDLTLKTGNAFHARCIGDFATWLVCGAAAREEAVKHSPHIRDAIWGSLRRAESYTELHYYSNICRLFRFRDCQEMYVKFKLRPYDKKIGEENGRVEPIGVLPPETGAIPRDEGDERPRLFLAEDFQRRVNSPDKVRYVLQLQMRPVPDDEEAREAALDCTRPWEETEFPHLDVGEVTIDQHLNEQDSEGLEFNPFLRCPEVDVIRASSCNESASMDHGRSVVYAICQHLRKKKPIPEAWRAFLNQSDVKVDLSGCPMAAAAVVGEDLVKEVTLERPWYVTFWLVSAQPLLQIFLPYFIIGLVIFAPLNLIFYLNKMKKAQMIYLLPFFWLCSGIVAGIACALSKWILVGEKKEGEIEAIWSMGIFMDTTWQAIKTLVGEYFMEMASGSMVFNAWMEMMGSEVAWCGGAYVDSMGAVLNPELMRIEQNGVVEREALLFGHIYEGEAGKVKYGRIVVKRGGFVGSRGVAMPGATVAGGGSLAALSLAMKQEFVN